MLIEFSPVRSEDVLVMAKSGETLTVNGTLFDFSGVSDGATLPKTAVTCDWLASDIERIDGRLCLTVFLPHRANAPESTLFPEPVTVTEDGPIPVPVPTQENAE